MTRILGLGVMAAVALIAVVLLATTAVEARRRIDTRWEPWEQAHAECIAGYDVYAYPPVGYGPFTRERCLPFDR